LWQTNNCFCFVCERRREEVRGSLVFSKRTTFLQFAVMLKATSPLQNGC
jgi:hypothetical protein